MFCFCTNKERSVHDPFNIPWFFRFLRIILLGAVIFRIWLNMIISELLSFLFQKRQTTTNKNYSRAPSHRVTFVKGHVDSCKRRKKEGKANGTHILTKGPWDIRNPPPPTPKEKKKDERIETGKIRRTARVNFFTIFTRQPNKTRTD